MILLIHVHDFHGVDFFWRALQLHALEGMQQALANPTNSSAFSSCVAVRIVRNLLYFAVNAREEHLQSSAQSNSAKKFRMEPCRGVVLPRIVDLLANQPSRSLMATGGGQGSSPLQAAGHLLGAIQHIFYGTWYTHICCCCCCCCPFHLACCTHRFGVLTLLI